ncbi:hypothetical protein E3P77_02298 [Wallemia ichthyophaga]|uniref:RAVE complex protein Rav1 C-terminal domain-containing protein n=1 Tax=Wallemia ichthyophaga TaxID=245174 RepID=A0A4T0I0Y9_WALIC|nr:hypothetical protein E3P90_02965 [Wallemia ichthyophaga]TIB10339.1 hypothetical protein E3P93_02904 [Wallemia ichthyophaga]TIB20983.1 hypothetical protein E3P89_02898 [Wallemia ichthyophaga]TIB22648.1 hypothetical protein E3P88_02916 [Wallemia ichthyophaga]TIB66435.1 hypothetical protein E3P77_02298 [Wallemia ichthyophaga]
MTPSSVSVYQNFILSSTAPSTNPHIPSLSPNSCYLAMSHLGSSTVLLQRTPSLSPFQSLPHLSPIRSLQWRDNSLLIVETSDNDLYAYIRSSPTKFDPWTIYVSPCLLRSFWLGPSTTDLLLRRALSDSNYLFHQNSPLSSLIATRRYESVSQISQFSRDLILNFSSDGYNLSINAINDTSHSTCNYIRSSPIVQLKLNEYIPNDITDIRLTCSSSHSPIYIIALRDANRGLLVGVLNPASIFDPVPDTNLHPPIHWLRNADHAQHTYAIRFITTDPLGQTLSTYSHQDGKLIHWHVVDTPSNAMHKLGILNSVASLDGLQDVYASIHVHNAKVFAIAFQDRVEVHKDGSLVRSLPFKASTVLFTSNSKHLHVVEHNDTSMIVTWLALSSCDVVHRETLSPILHSATVSTKYLTKANIPSYKSRSRPKSVVTYDIHPLLLAVNEDGRVIFVEIEDKLRTHTSDTTLRIEEFTNSDLLASCSHSRHTAVAANGKVRIYNYHNILEHEYAPSLTLNMEFLSLADYEGGVLLLVNESNLVRIWVSTHDVSTRWIELTRLTLPAYESTAITAATFLHNGTVALVTNANIHIQSVLHLLSTSLSPYLDGFIGASEKPLRQLSLYEVVALVAGPVQEWYPGFMARCVDLGYTEMLRGALRRLRRAIVHHDMSKLVNAFVFADEEDCEEDDEDSRYPVIDEQFINALSTVKGFIGSSAYDSLSNIIRSIQLASDNCTKADEYAWKAVYYASLANRLNSHIALFALLSQNEQLISDVLPNDAATLLAYPSIWLPDQHYQSKMEIIAKKMSTTTEDTIDPSRYAVSVVYFALKKKSSVLTLWKYAYGHKERENVVRFLSRDFDGDGEQAQVNRVAATKNAYVLLSKRRYDYAAAFFVLAHKHADATKILIKHCTDYELALCVARSSGDNTLFNAVLKDMALWAVRHGDTALVVAALIKLDRKVLASKCLLDMKSALRDDFFANTVLGDPCDLDFALVGLYNNSAIPKAFIEGEGKVAMRCANQLARDGCHVLAVKLLSEWKFGGVKERLDNLERNTNTAPQSHTNNSTLTPAQPKTNIVASQPKQSSQHVDQFDMSAFGF